MATGFSAPRPAYLRSGVTPPPTLPQGYQPPVPQPTPPPVDNFYGAPPVAPKPTFAPPSTGIDPALSITTQQDPRIQALLTQLKAQPSTPQTPGGQSSALTSQLQDTISRSSAPNLQELAAPVNVQGPDFSGINAQSAKLRELLTALSSGQSPDIGDINADPAAIAYRVSQDRAADRGRVSEAARLGASGATGGGDFDARSAQLREAAGENTSAFVGNLANQRRGEAIQAQETSAALQLNELNRETAAEQSRYAADLDKERLRREGVAASETSRSAAENTKAEQMQRLLDTVLAQEGDARSAATQGQQFNTQSTLALLQTLLAEQGRVQGKASSDALTAEGLRRAEIDRGKLYQYPVTSTQGQFR